MCQIIVISFELSSSKVLLFYIIQNYSILFSNKFIQGHILLIFPFNVKVYWREFLYIGRFLNLYNNIQQWLIVILRSKIKSTMQAWLHITLKLLKIPIHLIKNSYYKDYLFWLNGHHDGICPEVKYVTNSDIWFNSYLLLF